MDEREIINKLQTLFDTDNELRNKYLKTHSDADLQKIKEVDAESTSYIKKILNEFGPPSIGKIGKQASFYAWKLVQHSADQTLQEKYLKIMERNLNDFNKRDYAYLKDRVLLAQGRKQIYGTQFTKDPSGSYIAINLDNPEHVNERRSDMELDTLEENIERMKRLYG